MAAAPESTPNQHTAAARLRPWLSPRHRRFWLALALLFYTLAGFFLVPWALERIVVKSFAETGRTATLGRVAVNPFLLTATIENARLDDTDGETLLAYDEYFLDFQFSSLFRWAWTLKTIRIVGLEVFEERFAPADTRFLRLFSDLNPPAEEAAAPSDEARNPPRLIVRSFEFTDGSLRVIDRLAGDFEGRFGPISVSMNDLQTLPDRAGTHAVTIETNNGGTIEWDGDIQAVPFASRGEFSITGRGLADAFRYADHYLPFRIEGSGADIRFAYDVSLSADGLTVSVDGLESTTTGVRLVPDGEETAVLSTTEIRLSGGALRWPEGHAMAEALTVEGLDLAAALEADGSLSLMRLIPAGGDDVEASAEAPDADMPFLVELGRLELPAARIRLEDRTREPAQALALEDLRLLVTGLDNRDATAMPLELDLRLSSGGTVTFGGEATALPALKAKGRLNLREVALAPAQPYVEDFARVALASGSLGMAAELVHGPEQPLGLQGSLELSNLEVRDQVRDERLVGWSRLGLDRFEIDLAAGSVATSELEFLEPYGRLHIAEDLSTNIGGVLVPATHTAEADAGASSPTPEITLGGLRFEDAALDFSDFSLPLPFEAQIRELSGNVSTLAMSSAEPAAIDLEGRVNEYGSARIEGEINAWSPTDLTHIDMVFRNLDMSRLTPYTVQFAGYAIEDGRLDLDLGYRIDERLLKGQNSVVIREMKLGEKVDHPDAGSLPLGLAVALLTNADGVIDLDLPVEGDLDNPEFRIGKVVWQAIGNLITKVVTAPFRLLGGLVGIDSEDFGVLEFSAGEFDVSPPDREKLVKLGEAMLQRPELTIAVPGVYAPGPDRSALARQALAAEIRARSEGEDAGAELSTERERRIVEALFAETFPGTALESVQALHRQAPAEGEAATDAPLDEPAYVTALRERLVEQWPIPPEQLEALARARAEAVSGVLSQSQPDATLNVVLGEVRSVEPGTTGAIPLELEVTVGEAPTGGP